MTVTYSQYNVYAGLTPVRLVDTANLAGTYLNGTQNNGVGATLTAPSAAALTVNSVAVKQNDRILLVAQDNGNENGIYVATSAGSGSSLWQLTRAADLQNIEQLIAGQFVTVGAGSDSGAVYTFSEPLPAHFGVDDLDINPASVPGAGTYLVASNNLSDLVSAQAARVSLGFGTVAMQYTTVAITAAQWNGMYTTPKLMIAAPGANKLIVLHKAISAMTFVSAAYAAGGVVGFQYDSTAHGAGVAASNTQQAADFFAAASTSFQFEGVSGNTVAIAPFSTTVNKGLYLSNLTGAFTTGDSTWVGHLFYSVIATA